MVVVAADVVAMRRERKDEEKGCGSDNCGGVSDDSGCAWWRW